MISPLRSAYGAPTGFTLVELAIVVALIAIVTAIAVPRLLPTIAFSQLEGAARHVASYGRNVMAHCALAHDRITVKFDLDTREYWAVRWPLPEAEREEPTGGDATQEPQYAAEGPASDTDSEAAAEEIRERFDRFARLVILAKASRVKHEGILDEIGPLFDKEFTLDDEGKEEEEIKLLLLARTELPEDVTIESIQVGQVNKVKGTVEVEVTPLGLSEPVVFFLKGGSEEYYTVSWDAITGGAHLSQGKEETL
jgi:prepilin-type N-terminal cleavage/methylation domain-containing protein